MSKLILFPNVGRIEPFDSFKNARTVVQVTHRLELQPPQAADDYFRLVDHISAEVEIVATLKSGKDEVEATVRRFAIEVPPTTSVFLDSEFYASLGKKAQKNMKKRAWVVSNYLERQARAAQYMQDEPDIPPSHQPHFGSSPLSLPQTGLTPSSHAMRRDRYEITPMDTAKYESALNRIGRFMQQQNAKSTTEPVEYKLNQFFGMLKDSQPGSREMADTIRRIEKVIATEIGASIQLIG